MARVKKWTGYALLAFVAFYLLTSPESAAQIIEAALGGLLAGGEALSRFVNALMP
ncbi:hypothetical protein [Halostreptopolyspora alba]|uniref:hypothetical protein n=1 Tax=Halostreptopolyspora alba TaxID=2487137 RepID=UPI00267890CB